MNIGEKLLNLRKKAGLSQESVADKLNVTRQTVSNWELNQTKPDLEQAASICKLYNISLDELINNDVQNILTEKISNTDKLAGIVIKILKVIGVLFLIFIIIDVLSLIIFNGVLNTWVTKSSNTENIICTIDDKDYEYTISYDDNNIVTEVTGSDEFSELINFPDNTNSEVYINKIKEFFQEKNGTCE